jgi:hypothetical protein
MANATQHKKIWNTSLFQWLIIPLSGGILIGLVTNTGSLQSGNFRFFLQTTIISFVYWSTLANGNAWMIDQIDKKYTWLDAPIKRTLIGIVAMLVYSVSVSLIILYIYITYYFKADFWGVVEANGWFNLLSMPLIITVILSLWGHGRAFLLEWRQSAIDVERLKNENLKSKFESMKSQINPHFLFNSLNALSSLVYENQADAVVFIRKLSEVYRYVLDHQHDEVVDIQEEMSFLKAYVFLNKIRFGDKLEVHFHPEDTDAFTGALPPLALQMVVENAIKHNEISKEHPLRIDIRKNGEGLEVINNLNPVAHKKSDAHGLGLKNIRARYQYLSDQAVEARHGTEEFFVYLPILNYST